MAGEREEESDEINIKALGQNQVFFTICIPKCIAHEKQNKRNLSERFLENDPGNDVSIPNPP